MAIALEAERAAVELGPGRVLEVADAAALRRVELAPLALVAFYSQSVKQQVPILEEVAAEFGAALLVAVVDIVAHPDIAARYGVRGLPSAVLLRSGEVVKQLPGSQPKHLYVLAVNPLLAPGLTHAALLQPESIPVPPALLALFEGHDALVAARI